MKEKWFQYVVDNKNIWANGFTLKRLERIKDVVLNDEHIMFDLLKRHSAEHKTPAEMKESDAYTFNHCIGNFVCDIFNKMVQTEIIRS